MTWPIAATDHPSTATFAKDYDMYTYKNLLDWSKGNIKGTTTLKVAEYTEKTSNACAPKVQLNYLRKK